MRKLSPNRLPGEHATPFVVQEYPEGWEDALKQMILLHGVQVTPVEARAIVKYLGGSHGLAPDEAKPILYEPERRIHDESGTFSMSLRGACAKCHSMAPTTERCVSNATAKANTTPRPRWPP